MTSTQDVEILVSRFEDYTHPSDHTRPTYDMTPGLKPFATLRCKLREELPPDDFSLVAWETCVGKE